MLTNKKPASSLKIMIERGIEHEKKIVLRNMFDF